MRMLVVEEDELLAEFLRERLAEETFEVRLANRRDQAEPLLESENFDGMILDLSLPEGLELLRHARSLRPNLMITVLAPASSPPIV